MIPIRRYPAFFPSPVDVGIFTKTEIEVLKRTYLPHKHIADDMNISPHTVSTHLQNLRHKTGHAPNELITYAAIKGFIN